MAPTNYTRNRMYSDGCQRHNMMPRQDLTAIKPTVSNLCMFGCVKFVNIPIQFRSEEFASHAKKGLMVGYFGGVHRVYVPEMVGY